MIGVLLSNNYPAQWLPLAIFYRVLVGFSFLGVLLLSIAGLRKTDERSEFISDNDKTINVVAAH
jgi:hypothetical protein